jgi:hypothetical protein
LIVISYQDIKDRLIYWFLPVLVALALAFVHYETVGIFNFMWNSIFNVLLVSSILIILKVYVRFRFREGNFSNYFGFGDVLFIYAIALGFATVAFITLFVFGLFFSLLLHWIFASNILNVSKKSEKHQTSVPLAGYLSLFYIGILLTHWLGGYDQLYVI